MKKQFRFLTNTLYKIRFDLSAKTFFRVYISGASICMLMSVTAALNRGPLNVVLLVALESIVIFGLLLFGLFKGRYQLIHMIAIIVIFVCGVLT